MLDGVAVACRALDWRRHARRLAVLVGDAPPHGVDARGDGFPNGCPCGETLSSVSAAAEEARVVLYALGMTAAVGESFTTLARLTGGEYFPANRGADAMHRLRALLTAEFGRIDLDRRLLAAYQSAEEPSVEELASQVGEGRHAVAAALVRLVSRELIAPPT